jgi:predicted dinucleotide-binding enzyme
VSAQLSPEEVVHKFFDCYANGRVMTITRIIGSGLVGGNLARAAMAYGYDVVISNARGTADTRRPASGTRAESLGRHRSSRGRVGDFAIVAIPPLASCRVFSHAAPLRQPS